MGNSKRRWLKPDIGRPSLQNPSSSIYDNLVIHRQVYDFMGRTWLRYIAKVRPIQHQFFVKTTTNISRKNLSERRTSGCLRISKTHLGWSSMKLHVLHKFNSLLFDFTIHLLTPSSYFCCQKLRPLPCHPS